MTEKRYYSVDYDEEYYIFDSDVIQKGRVEEEAEYSYDVFADSMSGDEIVDLLNEQDETIKKLKKENKRLQIELNSQDDYIDYLEKHNEKLKERIAELASNDKVIFVSL